MELLWDPHIYGIEPNGVLKIKISKEKLIKNENLEGFYYKYLEGYLTLFVL